MLLNVRISHASFHGHGGLWRYLYDFELDFRNIDSKTFRARLAGSMKNGIVALFSYDKKIIALYEN